MRTAFVVLLGLALAGCRAPERAAAPPVASNAQVPAPAADPLLDPAWARDSIWDDGQAEVSLYDARRPQYRKIESYQAVFIVVKEDFTRDRHVKADPPYEGKQLDAVLKLNAVHSYWTDNYPYHFLASTFVRRDNPAAVVKMTVGSQEWCGNTFKEITTWGERPMLIGHSYFDREGDASLALDLRSGDLLEDQLPIALRGIPFRAGLTFERRLLPSIISNKTGQPAFANARFEVLAREKIGALAAWKVRVQWPSIEQSWWFEDSPLHPLVKMESSDGRSWMLRSRVRKAYWREPTFRPAVD